jgi:hypothetical protein
MIWSIHEAKMFVEHSVSISPDALHMLVGFFLLLLIAGLMRRPLSSWRPFLAVLVLLLLNEGIDLWVEQWPDPAIQWGESAKDLIVTLAVPLVLVLTCRFAPGLYEKAGTRAEVRSDLAAESSSDRSI